LWWLVDERSGETFPGRRQTNSYAFTKPIVAAYWRLDLLTLKGPGEDVRFQLAEISLVFTPPPVTDTPAESGSESRTESRSESGSESQLESATGSWTESSTESSTDSSTESPSESSTESILCFSLLL
jgi:hypothetical protein